MTKHIALTTDFGYSDPFVGIMKGVMAGIAPDVPQVDITHAIPPGDIQRGAIVLWQSAPYFPPGTVFLSVVDPGVGTARKAIVLQAQNHIFVGPDNGLFSYLLAEEEGGTGVQAWELTNLPPADMPLANSFPSSTFHGRDVFAPAAAHVARGGAPSALGARCQELVRLPSPTLEVTRDGVVRGEILTRDQFGNLLTSLGRFRPTEDGDLRLVPWIGRSKAGNLSAVVKCSPTENSLHLPNGKTLPLVDTFAHIPPGECAALVGSTGLLEIAANGQSAAALLGLKRGAVVELGPKS